MKLGTTQPPKIKIYVNLQGCHKCPHMQQKHENKKETGQDIPWNISEQKFRTGVSGSTLEGVQKSPTSLFSPT
jgi:hypothetical protein